jgi:hypothetical protein
MRAWVDGLQARLLAFANLATDALYAPSRSGLSRGQRWLERSWLAGLYALGLVGWAMFLDWGRIPFAAEDWVKEWVSYTILRQAVTRGAIPFHMSSLIQGTDRFLAIPETLVSPQILLLRLVDIGPFILLNTLILFTVGFCGLLLLKRHLRLSPFVFSVLFLLFAFNGHITAQVAIGHAMWVGYFILPFFLLLVFQALDGTASRNWPLWMALTLFGILLQGAIHIYIWCLFFLGLLWLAAPRLRMHLVLAVGASLLLGMFRLLPAGLAFPRGSPTFYAGYSSLTQMIGGLVTLITPAQAPVMNTPVGWWEYDMYIGLLGLAYLAFFGLRLRTARDPESDSGGSSRRALWVPIAVLAVLSLGHFYYPFHSLPIPMIGHERVPSRFLILPLLTVAVLASASAQRWLDRRPTRLAGRLVGLGLLIVFAQDLLQHARLWRLEVIAQSFSPIPPDLSLHIANRPDPTYLGLLGLGMLVSVVTLVFTIVRLARGKKGASPAQPSSA